MPPPKKPTAAITLQATGFDSPLAKRTMRAVERPLRIIVIAKTISRPPRASVRTVQRHAPIRKAAVVSARERLKKELMITWRKLII
jgi:hypothetical protein